MIILVKGFSFRQTDLNFVLTLVESILDICILVHSRISRNPVQPVPHLMSRFMILNSLRHIWHHAQGFLPWRYAPAFYQSPSNLRCSDQSCVTHSLSPGLYLLTSTFPRSFSLPEEGAGEWDCLRGDRSPSAPGFVPGDLVIAFLDSGDLEDTRDDFDWEWRESPLFCEPLGDKLRDLSLKWNKISTTELKCSRAIHKSVAYFKIRKEDNKKYYSSDTVMKNIKPINWPLRREIIII